jgi:hypothetical protein
VVGACRRRRERADVRTNAAGVIPIVEALLEQGRPMATLAFMMSVIALSLPEMIILKRIADHRLIAIFLAVVATGIHHRLFLFNIIMWLLPRGHVTYQKKGEIRENG